LTIHVFDDFTLNSFDGPGQAGPEQGINNRVVRRGQHTLQKLLPTFFRVAFE